MHADGQNGRSNLPLWEPQHEKILVNEQRFLSKKQKGMQPAIRRRPAGAWSVQAFSGFKG
jgi:hypothetical protein